MPVIFITAYPERLLTGERPEPTFLITKPFLPETVKATVGQALFFHPVRAQRSRLGQPPASTDWPSGSKPAGGPFISVGDRRAVSRWTGSRRLGGRPAGRRGRWSRAPGALGSSSTSCLVSGAGRVLGRERRGVGDSPRRCRLGGGQIVGADHPHHQEGGDDQDQETVRIHTTCVPRRPCRTYWASTGRPSWTASAAWEWGSEWVMASSPQASASENGWRAGAFPLSTKGIFAREIIFDFFGTPKDRSSLLRCGGGDAPPDLRLAMPVCRLRTLFSMMRPWRALRGPPSFVRPSSSTAKRPGMRFRAASLRNLEASVGRQSERHRLGVAPAPRGRRHRQRLSSPRAASSNSGVGIPCRRKASATAAARRCDRLRLTCGVPEASARPTTRARWMAQALRPWPVSEINCAAGRVSRLEPSLK